MSPLNPQPVRMHVSRDSKHLMAEHSVYRLHHNNPKRNVRFANPWAVVRHDIGSRISQQSVFGADKSVTWPIAVPMLPFSNLVRSVVDSLMICEPAPIREFVSSVVFQDILIASVPIVRICPNESFVEFAFRVDIIVVRVDDVRPMLPRAMQSVLSVNNKDISCVEK